MKSAPIEHLRIICRTKEGENRVTYSTSARYIGAATWGEMVKKLGATPNPKSSEKNKMMVLDHFGSAGWSLVTHLRAGLGSGWEWWFIRETK